ncbi:MAG: hypothetical protein ACRC3B_04975, partial [Bacteroidia bacterium]
MKNQIHISYLIKHKERNDIHAIEDLSLSIRIIEKISLVLNANISLFFNHNNLNSNQIIIYSFWTTHETDLYDSEINSWYKKICFQSPYKRASRELEKREVLLEVTGGAFFEKSNRILGRLDVAKKLRYNYASREEIGNANIVFNDDYSDNPQFSDLLTVISEYITKFTELHPEIVEEHWTRNIDIKKYTFNFPGIKQEAALQLLAKPETARTWIAGKLKSLIENLYFPAQKCSVIFAGSNTQEVDYTADLTPEEFKANVLKAAEEQTDVLWYVHVNYYAENGTDLLADLAFKFNFNAEQEKAITQLPYYEWRSYDQPLDNYT